MNKFETKTQSTQAKLEEKNKFAHTYYTTLGLHPLASSLEIRKAYRELSKQYHPDTTKLTVAEAKSKFQQLNEAYGILSNPEKRSIYDLKMGYSRWNVIQPTFNNENNNHDNYSRLAYLDPNDRPLSGGEIFALLMMGLTLLGCLLLAITIAWLRGNTLH